jgi:hypothetical protein
MGIRSGDDPMVARHVSYEFAILAMLCGAVIFFLVFPATQGPYSVVNGPVTTLISIRARLALWLGMVLAAVRLLGIHRLTQGLMAQYPIRLETLLPESILPEQETVLRC